MKKVLIVETEVQMAPVLQPVLEAAGFAVRVADHREDVVAQLGRAGADVVLVNLEGLSHEGLAIVRAIRTLCPGVAVITLNDPQNMDLSIQAMRMGVFDDLFMPLNVESLIGSIRKAVATAGGNAPEPALKPATTPRLEGDPP
jgi:DNA-binding NtrC family response regulator